MAIRGMEVKRVVARFVKIVNDIRISKYKLAICLVPEIVRALNTVTGKA